MRHLRHNCTRLDDYKQHSFTLKKTFLDKGYPLNLTGSFYQTESMPISTKKTPESITRFITQYHASHRKMDNIFKKHWSILTQDPHLTTSLSTLPKFAYRKALSVKSKIVPSKIKSQATTTLKQLTLIPLVGLVLLQKGPVSYLYTCSPW